MILIPHPSDPRIYLSFEDIFKFGFIIKFHFLDFICSHIVFEIQDRNVLNKECIIILSLMLSVYSVINVVLYFSVYDEKYY